MSALRRLLAGIAALACLCLCSAAEARGRASLSPSIYAADWRQGAVAPYARSRHDAQVAADWRAPGWRAGAAAIAAGAAWRSGADLVAEAARYVGSGKFTGLPGAWCADAVSFWLTRTGRAPLANRMAASALRYGPHVASPQAGDLVVMATRRGAAGHVGIVAGVAAGGSIEIISGNWGRRVARAVIPRGDVTAFVRP